MCAEPYTCILLLFGLIWLLLQNVWVKCICTPYISLGNCITYFDYDKAIANFMFQCFHDFPAILLPWLGII